MAKKKKIALAEDFGEIEKGVPLPPVSKAKVTRTILDSMSPGDSVQVFTKKAVNSISNLARQRGCKGAYRMLPNDGGYRFWLISRHSDEDEEGE